ncbi:MULTISPECIES: formylglycine-generating enzyme family protein [unclassified Thiocapsa]|uniref:formylglycine-generating enzyme family protein n=1 Tax=unclassified Thiocapsa TaxID=2641286 RepID=UPI0035AFEE1A
MGQALHIDSGWHPLIHGCPPAFATEWGEDRFGIFIGFTLGDLVQRLRWIPAGAFRMGSPVGEPGRFDNEGPQHDVYISRGFWLFDTPCTQALWAIVMGENPSRFKSPDRPVEQVSWNHAQDFLARINARIPGLDLVLPTEAQWEHACRAGPDTAIYSGPIDIKGENNAPPLDPIAWYGGNSGVDFDLDDGWDSALWRQMQYPNPRSGTRPVGKKQPNAWGLYDMIGNVWEWCDDGVRDYDADWRVDPVGPVDAAGAARVVRGGSWGSGARDCRSACRAGLPPDDRYDLLGFRPARVQVS